MFNAYDRVKKHRILTKRKSGSSTSSNEDQSMGESSYSVNEQSEHDESSASNAEENINLDETEEPSQQSDEEHVIRDQPDHDVDEVDDDVQHTSDDDDSDNWLNEPVEDENQEDLLDLQRDLRIWAVQNIGNLKNKTITALLRILREHGHRNLPETAETLLGTMRLNQDAIRLMEGLRGYGKYVYLGIEKELARRIAPDIFVEETIQVLVNIDGLPLYRKSTRECWPILVEVCSHTYTSRPFIVGMYCGKSKPANANVYLKDFVLEAASLTQHGINIQGKHYNFKIKAIICDTPARAFIKCIKGHGGFYACERCTVKGVSVDYRRVYARTDCPLRTHATFVTRSDANHHKPGQVSPLLRIPNFDIVRAILLDSMHLLFIGIMKALLEKWQSGNPLSRIRVLLRQNLADTLNLLGPHIPCEFQRKSFDFMDLSNWKATQFRFFLLYCGPLVLKDVLSDEKYKHFLLLHTACRVLCTSDSAVTMVDYAKTLLIKFVELMPTLYGTDSQTINFHNLIHVADDVEYMGAALSYFTAFPFENCLGQIKRLVRTPNLPLSQIFRRMSELNATSDIVMQPHSLISKCELKEKFVDYQREYVEYKQVVVSGMTIKSCHPDNLVLLENHNHLEINKIFSREKRTPKDIRDLYVTGRIIESNGDVFDYPCQSRRLGIYVLGSLDDVNTTVPLSEITRKCINLTIHDKNYSIALLHN